MLFDEARFTNATVVDDAIRFVREKVAAAVNAEPRTDHPVVIEDEKQQEDNITERQQQQKLDNNSATINQVF